MRKRRKKANYVELVREFLQHRAYSISQINRFQEVLIRIDAQLALIKRMAGDQWDKIFEEANKMEVEKTRAEAGEENENGNQGEERMDKSKGETDR